MKSNIDDILKQAMEFIDSFNFERPGVEGSLGKDCAHAVAERIADLAATEQRTSDNEDFPDNEPRYADWKNRKYNTSKPAFGIRTGQMLSIQSLLGDVEVEPGRVTMSYGTGQAPDRSGASDYISESDKRTTDREKAGYISKRVEFYKAGSEGRAAVVEVVKEALDKAIREENGK